MNQNVRHTPVFVTVHTALSQGLWAAEKKTFPIQFGGKILKKILKQFFFRKKNSHQLWQLWVKLMEMGMHLIHLFLGSLSSYSFYPYMFPSLLPEMLQVIDGISWTYPGRGFLEIYNSKRSKAMIWQDLYRFCWWKHLKTCLRQLLTMI